MLSQHRKSFTTFVLVATLVASPLMVSTQTLGAARAAVRNAAALPRLEYGFSLVDSFDKIVDLVVDNPWKSGAIITGAAALIVYLASSTVRTKVNDGFLRAGKWTQYMWMNRPFHTLSTSEENTLKFDRQELQEQFDSKCAECDNLTKNYEHKQAELRRLRDSGSHTDQSAPSSSSSSSPSSSSMSSSSSSSVGSTPASATTGSSQKEDEAIDTLLTDLVAQKEKIEKAEREREVLRGEIRKINKMLYVSSEVNLFNNKKDKIKTQRDALADTLLSKNSTTSSQELKRQLKELQGLKPAQKAVAADSLADKKPAASDAPIASTSALFSGSAKSSSSN